jgi:hypothetical protein
MKLHKAFIDAAAKPLLNNLAILIYILSGNPISNAEKCIC